MTHPLGCRGRPNGLGDIKQPSLGSLLALTRPLPARTGPPQAPTGQARSGPKTGPLPTFIRGISAQATFGLPFCCVLTISCPRNGACGPNLGPFWAWTQDNPKSPKTEPGYSKTGADGVLGHGRNPLGQCLACLFDVFCRSSNIRPA